MHSVIEKAADVIDSEVNTIAYTRGLTYAEALARLRDEQPDLLCGFYRVYRQESHQRTREPLFDRSNKNR